MKPKLIGVALGLALLASATTTHAQTVETGMVKLADSNIQYFSGVRVKRSCYCQVEP
jgi:hypothetical protein